MDKTGVNITMAMFDAAVDFMCHNNGDRIARESYTFLYLVQPPRAIKL